ncbi:uncharacterized protein LOC131224078 [Magnolia sinica]|uniref:uncharacterized protein LOC131224078 n=1 Tax=Magnolia sinica TaxID=86752 RepID=UPI00265B57F0|nr:uncharacterized protein LOC131224078 [Magnolia sinica]
MTRRTQIFESIHLIDTPQICRESIRILLLHPTQFQSISIFLFSPLPISLFLSHLLIHQYPKIPPSTFKLTTLLFGQDGPPFEQNGPLNILSNSLFSYIMCFPSSITFLLLGKAATAHLIANTYNGIGHSRRRLLARSGVVWVKLLHTWFWEFLIVLGLSWVFGVCLATLPNMLFAYGICSKMIGVWVVLGFLGIPFCIVFAHVMVVGSLAKVVSVLEEDCYGFESLVKAKDLIKGRRQTALAMALISNVGLRLVEGLFEFRLWKGISMWEGPMLVSMYSLVLVLDTVMNVVFFFTCKP